MTYSTLAKLSIVIPAYNEEKRIGKTLESYCNFFRTKVRNNEISSYEIIVVLNNCHDKTLEITKDLKKKFNEIGIMDLKPGGKGFAITEGFKEILKESTEPVNYTQSNHLIGFVDADMATPPEAFFYLVKNINNYDGLIANRWSKKSIIKTKQTLLRRFVSRGFNVLIRTMFFLTYRDTQCGAKLFKKRVIEKVTPELRLTEWAFDINLLYLAGKNHFKIKEFPTIWEDKKDSKLNLTKVPVQMFAGILRLRLIYSPFRRLLKPLKFILKISDKILRNR